MQPYEPKHLHKMTPSWLFPYLVEGPQLTGFPTTENQIAENPTHTEYRESLLDQESITETQQNTDKDSSFTPDAVKKATPSLSLEKTIEVEKPKGRTKAKNVKPPEKPDAWKKVIGYYSFDTPPGESIKPVEGRINTILGGISSAKFEPRLTVDDLANAYEWNIDTHEDGWNAPMGSSTVVTMVRGWIKAGRPDYDAGKKDPRKQNQMYASDDYTDSPAADVDVSPIPKVLVDYRGYAIYPVDA